LIEKAYAKLNGTYHMIENNQPHNALEDLTGGLGYCTILQPSNVNDPTFTDNLWNDLQRDQEAGNSVMVFGTSVAQLGNTGYMGLHPAHAYTMTGITVLEEANNVKLIRMRNPWGNGEWEGDWSDKSPLWDSISAEQKQKLGYRALDDGEFWIEYSNVLHLFAQIDWCIGVQLNQTKLGQQAKQLTINTYYGSWNKAKGTAGGANNPAQCPQYLAFVGNPDANWDFDLLIALQQKTALSTTFNLSFGYRVYWVEDPTFQRWKLVDGFRFGPDFFEAEENKLIRTAGTAYGAQGITAYKFGRDVTDRFKVKAGTYLIVPSAEQPNVEADFVLRVWNDELTPIGIVQRIESISTTLNDDGTWSTTSSVQQL